MQRGWCARLAIASHLLVAAAAAPAPLAATSAQAVVTAFGITEYPLPGATSLPGGAAVGRAGTVWSTESPATRMGRFTPAGVVTEYPIPTATASRMESPPDGNLWFIEAKANRIGRVTTSGTITEFPIPTAGSAPTGI